MGLQEMSWGFMALGSLVALLNWFSVYHRSRTGRCSSPIPLVGAFFLGGGMLLHPAVRPFAWLALVLDYGTLALLLAVPWIVSEEWKTSRFNLLEQYEGKKGSKRVELRLFRKGVLVIKQYFGGESGLSLRGSWKREGDRLLLSLEEDVAVFDPWSGRHGEGVRQATGFRSHAAAKYRWRG